MERKHGHYYTVNEEETILEGIVTAVGAIENEDLTDLPALYDVIDPDYIESLFETGPEDLRITFQYAGYDIAVNGNRRIAVAEAQGENDRPLGECAHCGSEFELDVDYPVATRKLEDGVTFFSFCDQTCKAAWENTHRFSANEG